MLDGVPAQWQKPAAQWQKPADHIRNNTDEAAYVFLGIFLVALAVPAGFIIWAITTGLIAVLG